MNSRRWVLPGLVALSLIACGSSSPAATSAHRSPPPQVTPATPVVTPVVTASTPRTDKPSPSPTPLVASIDCTSPGSVISLALVSSYNSGSIYEVSDPTHPRLVCRIANTTAHLVGLDELVYLKWISTSETDVVRHRISNNAESTMRSVPAVAPLGLTSWLPDGSVVAYEVSGPNDAQGSATTQVWVYAGGSASQLFSYEIPGVDSFGRPGLPPPMLALSPDGAYLIGGWAIGKGTPGPLRLFRVRDRTEIPLSFASQPREVIWAPTGATLYVIESDRVERWTPSGGLRQVPGASPWTMSPNFSPDGRQVAYTGLLDNREVRVYTYDTVSAATHLVIDKPRSQAVFVKPDWLWYQEEAPCVTTDQNNFCFDPTRPTGTVLAKNLVTGDGGPVSFAAGESPMDAYGCCLLPGETWPRS